MKFLFSILLILTPVAAFAMTPQELAGRLQESYGIGKDDAERQIREFEDKNRDYRP